MRRRRLDDILIARGLARDAREALALAMAGRVTLDGKPITKTGALVADDAAVGVTKGKAYASRGGDKLAAALDEFDVDVAGRVWVDVGAATGGFTSCLLARGASHVHALDVARGALAWALRSDPRVTTWEGVNARSFDATRLRPTPTALAVDVSFISLTKVLSPFLAPGVDIQDAVVLVKPQFEAAREEVERGGVVRDAAVRERVVGAVAAYLEEAGYPIAGVCVSPLTGPAGNREYFLWGCRTAPRRDWRRAIGEVVHRSTDKEELP